jgi:dTDP-glucose 4,6-dehydratase
MAVLVTGGAGFIGSCFVRQWLAEEPGLLVVLDKLTYAGNLDSLESVWDHPRLVFQQGDIADRPVVDRLLKEHEVTAIAHLAAESHVDRSIDGPAPFVQTNVVGTFHLLEAALDYWRAAGQSAQRRFRFLHVSTDEVYGSLGATGRFSETSPYHPTSPYAASKASADHFVRAYQRTYNLPAMVTNCSNNYGPFQFPEKLIPLMIHNAIHRRPLPVYGDGSHVRDWLHVEDHCRGLRLVLKEGRPGETYNLGGDAERSNLEVVRHVCRTVDRLAPDPDAMPRESLIEFVADRPGHDRRYAIDASKTQHMLGWQRRFEFETGLEATVRWYLENQDWVERVSSGAYRGQRLGLRRTRRE